MSTAFTRQPLLITTYASTEPRRIMPVPDFRLGARYSHLEIAARLTPIAFRFGHFSIAFAEMPFLL